MIPAKTQITMDNTFEAVTFAALWGQCININFYA